MKHVRGCKLGKNGKHFENLIKVLIVNQIPKNYDVIKGYYVKFD